jgi:hypothetical protein
MTFNKWRIEPGPTELFLDPSEVPSTAGEGVEVGELTAWGGTPSYTYMILNAELLED